jgi:hypothetical protein
VLTGGNVPDRVAAGELFDQFVSADILHADEGYDSDAVGRKIGKQTLA